MGYFCCWASSLCRDEPVYSSMWPFWFVATNSTLVATNITLSFGLQIAQSWYCWKALEVLNLDMTIKNTLEMMIKTEFMKCSNWSLLSSLIFFLQFPRVIT